MARQATGQIIAHDGPEGRTFSLRFHAYGKRRFVSLGRVTRDEAERALRGALADVERGIWQPSRPAPVAPTHSVEPTFHEFASDWFAAKRRELGESTECGYRIYLTNHLLPFFAQHQLGEITVAEVDRYREQKLREAADLEQAIATQRPLTVVGVDRRGRAYERARKPLSAESINKTLKLLGQVLDVAEERGLIARNPMRVNPRNRKLKVRRPGAVWLDRAHQIEALLAAAGKLDAEAREDRQHVPRRAILSTLTFAGLQIGELCELRWRDVDLASGRLWVRKAKTDAGSRHVELLPALRDELTAHRASDSDSPPTAPVFATSTGGRMSERNVAQRVLEPAIIRANKLLDDAGHSPLPEGLTLHKLRHTCCSLLFVCGYELPRVMAMLGHADATTTLRVYAHVMAAGEDDRERLRALVNGVEWADNGQKRDVEAVEGIAGARVRASKNPA